MISESSQESLMKGKEVTIGCLVATDVAEGIHMLAGSVMAVDAINRDPSILPHHHLRLTTANYSMTAPIASMMAAYSVVRQRPVAVVGPHTSEQAALRPVAVIGPHTSEQAALVSPFATATQVPFVSASATDAQLTVGGTRPFFMRTVQSDGHQMRAIAGGWVCALPFSLYLPPGESNGHLVQAIADILAIYQWKAFIAIHSDDRYGGNGITALEACVLALNQRLQVLLEVDTAVCVLHTSTAVATAVILAATSLRFCPSFSLPAPIVQRTGWVWHDSDGHEHPYLRSPDCLHLKVLTLDPVRFPNVSRQWFHAASSHAENDVRGRIRHHLPVPWGDQQSNLTSHPQHPPQSSLMLSPPDPAFYPPRFKWGPMLRAAMLRTTFEGASGTISLSPWGDQQSNLTRILNIHSQATDQSTQSTQSTKSPMDATSAVTGSVSLQGKRGGGTCGLLVSHAPPLSNNSCFGEAYESVTAGAATGSRRLC
ncbi:unnamed protein product [Closterium sp. Naga37s-1]|nr:unnamed protein product [Closterium sp. Naga37s-1]